MRICHVIGSFRPVIGGAERATETLASAQHEQGHEVIVLTRRLAGADAARETINGVRVYRLGRPGRTKLNALTFALQAFALLATRLRHYRVLHVQDIDTSTFVGMFARLLPGRRLVTTIHGQWTLLGRSRSRTGRLRIKGMVRATDLFTSLNPENTRVLIDLGARREDIREIPNGIDTSVYQPANDDERRSARQSLGFDDDEFVALYMGRLETYKRVDLLIESWTRVASDQRRRLVIVGPGSESDRLREQAAGIGSIRFDGPTDEPVTYLRAVDVFVNPSGDPSIDCLEGLSVALLEAMFMGVAPIVTVGPGNDVVVTNEVTGLNFEVGDGDGLVACLTRAIEDPALRARLGTQARASVVDDYSSAAVAQEVTSIYRELRDDA